MPEVKIEKEKLKKVVKEILAETLIEGDDFESR